jgi:hypothetical protein
VNEYAEIEVVAGSTAKELAFSVGVRGRSTEPVESMVVFRVETAPCTADTGVSRTAVWLIHARDGVGSRPAPSWLAFGDTVAGYDTDVPPVPLKPGCYAVSLSGDGVRGFAAFRIRGDGTVEPRGTT